MATKVINLTPHEICLVGEGDEVVTRIPSIGRVARVSTRATEQAQVEVEGHWVPIVSTQFGEVEGLPEPTPAEGTIFIVSSIVLAALKGARKDVVAPDTGPTAVRNADGTVKGVRRFTR